MKGYKRFVSRHRMLLPTITAVLATLYALFMMELDASPWWALLFLPIYIILLGQGVSASTVLLTESLKPLNEDCDPYPFLDETTLQLTYVKGKGERPLLTLNHTAALMETGQVDKAYELLTTLPQSDLVNFPTVWLPFYLNLGQCELEVTGDVARAQVWYEQALRQLEGIKKPKQKAELADSARMLYVALQIAREDYETALATLAVVEDRNLRRQVEKAWAYARIAYAQGDIATAVRNLEYVIGYGNRLPVVQQAHALLAEVTAGRPEDESVSVKQQEIRRQSDETAI